jgi:hypothetical protein
MGLREIRIHCKKCISRIVIVALSAQPPGVNKLCVCVWIQEATVPTGDNYGLLVEEEGVSFRS